MLAQNKQSLESLSWFCHLCGMLSVFIGAVIILMNALDKEWTLVQSGFYIFATGYALVKISSKISAVTTSERIDQ